MGGRGSQSRPTGRQAGGIIGVDRSVTGANPPAGSAIGVDAGVTNARAADYRAVEAILDRDLTRAERRAAEAEIANGATPETAARVIAERELARRERSAARAAERNAEASRQLRAARAPSRMSEVMVRNADGVTGRIFRVPVGFRTGNRTQDTMFQVLITEADGRERWRTNRRGPGAFSQAKDDVAQMLGLERRRRS